MKLWQLSRTFEPTEYDVAYGYVVRAETEADARRMASEYRHYYGDHWGTDWLKPEATKCEEIAAAGEPGILIEDFNAG